MELQWHKSSFSGGGSACVEVARGRHGGYLVRDSKHRDGATLSFTADEWSAFIRGARAGEFGWFD